MLLLGCKPKGRHTEQHDIYFGIGQTVKDLIPEINLFWPEAKSRIHLDAWREVTYVDQYHITVVSRQEEAALEDEKAQLFFLNLGGYKPGESEEFHYKMLVAEKDKASAIQKAKQTAFYKHTGFSGAVSHIDDKYGVDIDDIYELQDILPEHAKEKYLIRLTPAPVQAEDEWHLGYQPLYKV